MCSKNPPYKANVPPKGHVAGVWGKHNRDRTVKGVAVGISRVCTANICSVSNISSVKMVLTATTRQTNAWKSASHLLVCRLSSGIAHAVVLKWRSKQLSAYMDHVNSNIQCTNLECRLDWDDIVPPMIVDYQSICTFGYRLDMLHWQLPDAARAVPTDRYRHTHAMLTLYTGISGLMLVSSLAGAAPGTRLDSCALQLRWDQDSCAPQAVR